MNLNNINSKYRELQYINKKLDEIEIKKQKLNSEIGRFKSYYSKDTKFENWELDCFIFNLAVEHDNLSFDEIPLLAKAKEIECELNNFGKNMIK